jgi:hypothetical protein
LRGETEPVRPKEVGSTTMMTVDDPSSEALETCFKRYMNTRKSEPRVESSSTEEEMERSRFLRRVKTQLLMSLIAALLFCNPSLVEGTENRTDGRIERPLDGELWLVNITMPNDTKPMYDFSKNGYYAWKRIKQYYRETQGKPCYNHTEIVGNDLGQGLNITISPEELISTMATVGNESVTATDSTTTIPGIGLNSGQGLGGRPEIPELQSPPKDKVEIAIQEKKPEIPEKRICNCTSTPVVDARSSSPPEWGETIIRRAREAREKLGNTMVGDIFNRTPRAVPEESKITNLTKGLARRLLIPDFITIFDNPQQTIRISDPRWILQTRVSAMLKLIEEDICPCQNEIVRRLSPEVEDMIRRFMTQAENWISRCQRDTGGHVAPQRDYCTCLDHSQWLARMKEQVKRIKGYFQELREHSNPQWYEAGKFRERTLSEPEGMLSWNCACDVRPGVNELTPLAKKKVETQLAFLEDRSWWRAQDAKGIEMLRSGLWVRHFQTDMEKADMAYRDQMRDAKARSTKRDAAQTYEVVSDTFRSNLEDALARLDEMEAKLHNQNLDTATVMSHPRNKRSNSEEEYNLPELGRGVGRIEIKNQVAYHFKRVVREVTQDILISRHLDVNPLLQAIEALRETKEVLQDYCDKTALVTRAYASRPALIGGSWSVDSKFVYLSKPSTQSWHEARGTCNAMGMQLPEIYSAGEQKELKAFMAKNNLTVIWAGVEYDAGTGIPRYLATGRPIWDAEVSRQGLKESTKHPSARYIYSNDGSIQGRVPTDSPSALGQYGNVSYLQPLNYTNYHASVVCMVKWDGTPLEDARYKTPFGGELVDVRLAKREINLGQAPAMTDLGKQLCYSVAEYANESYSTMSERVVNLLKQVDISVKTDEGQDREKRQLGISSKLAKWSFGGLSRGVSFASGGKVLWSLFMMAQGIYNTVKVTQVDRRTKKMKATLDQHESTIHNMSRMLQAHSLQVEQMTLAQKLMGLQLKELEQKVGILHEEIGTTKARVAHNELMHLVHSLLVRLNGQIQNSYGVLRSIVHASMMGQTSPYILPPDQVELIQNRVTKATDSDLDTKFSRMRSVVVGVPNDYATLLVLVSTTAIARRNLELVELIPIPFFEKAGTVEPKLDYQHVVLNQKRSGYTVLSEAEANQCQNGRCYLNNQEIPVRDKTCGIPQYYDHNLDLCEFQPVPSNGVFIKPLLPDGIVFALEKEARSQIFCKDIIGPKKTLNGTGVLRIPHGCTMTLTDAKGTDLEIKGLPITRVVHADDVKLIKHDLSYMSAIIGEKLAHHREKNVDFKRLMSTQLDVVQTEIGSIEGQIKEQNKYMWILYVLVALAILAIATTAVVMYFCSSRFRGYVEKLKEKLEEVRQLARDAVRKAEEIAITRVAPQLGRVGQKIKEMKALAMDPENKGKETHQDQNQKSGRFISFWRPEPKPSQEESREMKRFKQQRSLISLNELEDQAVESRASSQEEVPLDLAVIGHSLTLPKSSRNPWGDSQKYQPGNFDLL